MIEKLVHTITVRRTEVADGFGFNTGTAVTALFATLPFTRVRQITRKEMSQQGMTMDARYCEFTVRQRAGLEIRKGDLVEWDGNTFKVDVFPLTDRRFIVFTAKMQTA